MSPATRRSSTIRASGSAIVDPTTGEIREAEIFVGVLGASNLTYAEATWTQTLPDWIGAHVRMFRFFGGVPKLLVPDNLKSGVNKASFYDPEINRTYGAMAAHYSRRHPAGAAAKAAGQGEGRGRRQICPDLHSRAVARGRPSSRSPNATQAIALVMQRMNERPMRHLGLSRRELFEKIERAALIALPADDWEFAEWRRARVNLDYHIEVHDFLYSDRFRDLMWSPDYQALFPDALIAPNGSSLSEVRLTSKGYRLATTVQGPATGKGAHLIIVDDPFKAAEAASCSPMTATPTQTRCCERPGSKSSPSPGQSSGAVAAAAIACTCPIARDAAD